MSDNNTCLNCSAPLSGRYCSQCGEKVYDSKNKKVFHLFEEMAHFLTHFEGKFFTTLRTMFRHPGKMAQEYCQGIRKKYFKPVSFYFLLVVIYLVFPMFRGLNMTLEGHMGQDSYKNLAARMVASKQEQKKLEFSALKTKFEAKPEKVSKLMLLIVLPICALLLAVMFRRKHYYFFDHFILSAEVSSMLLLVLFLILPLLAGAYISVFGKQNEIPENAFIYIALAIQFTYSLVAFKKFYSASNVTAGITALLFSFAQLFVFLMLYKFLLFVTVMFLI